MNSIGSPHPTGDINGDYTVNFSDAIMVLQLTAGISQANGRKVFIDADVNGDGKIGLAEVLYILQKVAEMR